jgi:hypothetical protein
MINHPHRSKRARVSAVSGVAPARRPVRQRTVNALPGHFDFSPMIISVAKAFAWSDSPLFLTDAGDLAEVYLAALPKHARQHHNCSACRRFLRRFGSLAFVSDDGSLVPAMWEAGASLPDLYRPAVLALAEAVRGAEVTSVFRCKDKVWGLPQDGEWRHFAVNATARVHRPGALTAGQAMAASKENFKTVLNAMAEYGPAVLDEALRVLESGHLDRADKFVGPVRWLRKLHDWPKGRGKKRVRDNLLWQAIATAPEGYCHVKSSVVAPLLDDILAGVPFADLQRKHAAKVAPLQYQRPQAPPAAGNIAAAEKLFEKLGLAPALERRFARLDEVEAVWTPDAVVRRETVRPGSVFGHVKPKGAAPAAPTVDLPTSVSTWEKFSRTVLPGAERVEMLVPAHGSFIALTTAVNAGAPPILKWDNPVAWYVYPGGSPASQWGLKGSAWAPVTAVVPLPNLWGARPMPFLSEGVVLTIEGAMDTRLNSGNALFPECLRDDLHGARATVEAYSRSAQLSGRETGSACGYDVRNGAKGVCALRVFSGGAWASYQIDRWD